jgi:SHS family sialic acid transporter-like MFS transporter
MPAPHDPNTAAHPAIVTHDNVKQRGAWMVLLAAFLGWMFDGLEMGIHPLVADPAITEFYHTAVKANPAAMAGISENDYFNLWNGRIIALFLVGAALGGLVFGWLGDRIGRVKAMTLSILFYSGFTGLCYFTNAAWQMGGLRFLAALGMGGEWSLGVALVMEAWPAKHRPKLAGLIGAASNVGFMLIGLISPLFGTDWRMILVAGAMPAVLTFFIRIFVPESEAWQSAVEAEGKVNPVKEVFGPRWLNRTLLAIGLAGVALIGTWCTVQNIPPWVSKMTRSQYEAENIAQGQPKTMTTAQAEVVNARKSTAQVVSALGAIVGCLVAPFLGAVLSRKIAYFLLCAGSLAACSWLFRGFNPTEFTMLFQFVIFLAGLFTASFYGWLPLYLPELFPVRIRATGQGIAFNFGRVLAAVGALYIGDLTNLFKDFPNGGLAGMGATLAWVYAVGMVLILFAPETKGKPLPV